jgi:hypothetical protein
MHTDIRRREETGPFHHVPHFCGHDNAERFCFPAWRLLFPNAAEAGVAMNTRTLRACEIITLA